jgi:hypothetical protein
MFKTTSMTQQFSFKEATELSNTDLWVWLCIYIILLQDLLVYCRAWHQCIEMPSIIARNSSHNSENTRKQHCSWHWAVTVFVASTNKTNSHLLVWKMQLNLIQSHLSSKHFIFKQVFALLM